MSAAATTASTGPTGAGASASAAMSRKDVTCDYCDKLISECLCVTAPTHGRYCDYCGRAKQFCTCYEAAASATCGGCRKPSAECDCGQCRKCSRQLEHCVCVCRGCSYVGAACRCYEYADEAPHPDTLCCSHCYSDPCECDKVAAQKDRNYEADMSCPRCYEHYKRCTCRRDDDDGDD